jgi:CRP/FNR family transcriptional regulator, cyclic AMP receptor protein
MQEVVNLLRKIEFFHGIADEYLERVAAFSKAVEFPTRKEIFREDEPAKDVYFIVSGRVSLVICAPPVGCRQLVEAGDGELIGWSPLVGRSRLSDTAWTLTPTKAIAMEGARVLELCAKDPKFGFEFMQRAAQTLASRLGATRVQLLKLGGAQLPMAQIESD